MKGADRMRGRWVSLLVLFALNAVAQTAGPGSQAASATASIRGRVIDSATGRPLGGVHVRLAPLARDSGTYGTMSNAEGVFSIPDVRAAEYCIIPEKRGLIFVPDPQKNDLWCRLALHLKPGERVDQLVLPMIARTIIAGRVFDQQGDPVSDVPVSATAVVGENSSSASTNGRGEFRLSVPPGKYYVRASPFYIPERTEEPFGSPSQTGYVPTYYREAIKVEDASIVEAFAGTEKNGVEINLARPGAFRVSGEITGISHCDRAPIYLFWDPADWFRTIRNGTNGGRLDFTTEDDQTADACSVNSIRRMWIVEHIGSMQCASLRKNNFEAASPK